MKAKEILHIDFTDVKDKEILLLQKRIIWDLIKNYWVNIWNSIQNKRTQKKLNKEVDYRELEYLDE